MSYEIQELDLENLQHLNQVAKLFGQELGPRNRQWWMQEALEWGNQAAYRKLIVFTAVKDGRIIGAALGLLHDPALPREVHKKLGQGKHYCLGGVAVSPHARRSRIATELNKKRLIHARSLGCRSVYGSTLSTNLSRKNQFEKEGYALFHVEQKPSVGEVHWYRKNL